MSEDSMTPEKLSTAAKPKSVTRRQFLKEAGVLIGAIAVSQIPDSSKLLRDKEQSRTQEDLLKESIEKEFNIKLHTFREDLREHIRINPGGIIPESWVKIANDSKLPDKWDMPRLLLLKQFLPLLPKHFYQPDDKGNKLVISLGETNACCSNRILSDPHHIELEHTVFLPYEFLDMNEPNSTVYTPFEALAHELTHTLTHTIKTTHRKVVGLMKSIKF